MSKETVGAKSQASNPGTTPTEPPTFNDEMRSQHKRLRLLLAAIDEVFAARAGQDEIDGLSSALVVLLEDLSGALPRHFEFEERGGYFSDVVRTAPRMSRDLERLRDEHVELNERARKLFDLALGAFERSKRWREVETAFAALSTRFLAHEREENGIIQEVFLMDIGEPG